jgi:hypothetical protein
MMIDPNLRSRMRKVDESLGMVKTKTNIDPGLRFEVLG